MMCYTKVNGPETHPVYHFLRETSSLKGAPIPWNFTKFLLDADGKVVKYYLPTMDTNAVLETVKDVMNMMYMAIRRKAGTKTVKASES